MLRKESQARVAFRAGPTLAATTVLSPVVQDVVCLSLEWHSVPGEILKMMLESFMGGEQLVAASPFGS